ncbi:variable surface protein [Plasmodium gonderi]|uniref:Variable surface protein n=1 Tax=Plasmodium gonderi TaxID=77519 RepID=A0A1Y1J956_PLAGO|nr:variable surface protein [Plasmodium gonderi]GAW79036.1 variable surface protein [Plasmodium gonderi]
MTPASEPKKASLPTPELDPPRIDFEHLPSYKFYESLKEEVNEDIISEYYSEFEDSIEKYNWVNDLLKKLIRNLSLVHSEEDKTGEFDKKHCFDLNYWLYEQVFSKLKENGKLGDVKSLISKFQDVWKKAVDKDFKEKKFACYPDEKLYSNMSYLQELKDLFDFFEDFKSLRKEILDDTFSACTKYCEYLRQRIPVYYTWRDSCLVKDYACKRYIDDYMKYRPSSLTFYLSFKVLLSYHKHPCLSDVYRIFVKAKAKPKRNDSLYKDLMYKSESENSDGNSFSAKAEDALPGSPLYIKSNSDSLVLYYTWKRIRFTYEKIFPYVLLFLGTLLIAYIVYKVNTKFTPLGRSMLRTRAKVRKRIKPYIDYDDIMLLSDSDESLISSSTDESYTVMYSSQ